MGSFAVGRARVALQVGGIMKYQSKAPYIVIGILLFAVAMSQMFFFMLMSSCHPAPAVPVQHDADGAQLPPAEAACAQLAALGCREGLDTHCSLALAHVVDAGLERFDLSCMANASSKDAMRSCAGMTGGCQ